MGLLTPQHGFAEGPVSSGVPKQDLLRQDPSCRPALGLLGDAQQGSAWAVFTLRVNQGSHHLTDAAGPPVLDLKLIQQPTRLAETADPQQNECELIISLLNQEHGPTLLVSAPVVDTDATTAN